MQAGNAGGSGGSGADSRTLPAVLCTHGCFWHMLMPLQLIRKKLKKCYKESGVNYQQNCRDLAQVCGAAGCRPPAMRCSLCNLLGGTAGRIADCFNPFALGPTAL